MSWERISPRKKLRELLRHGISLKCGTRRFVVAAGTEYNVGHSNSVYRKRVSTQTQETRYDRKVQVFYRSGW